MTSEEIENKISDFEERIKVLEDKVDAIETRINKIYTSEEMTRKIKNIEEKSLTELSKKIKLASYGFGL